MFWLRKAEKRTGAEKRHTVGRMLLGEVEGHVPVEALSSKGRKSLEMSSAYQFDEFMASAKAALEEGSTETAKEWVNRALSLRKHVEEEAIARAHDLKARILVAEEEYSEAAEVLQKSLDMFWRNAEGHELLAELMILDGRYGEAVSALETAVEMSPRNVDALSVLIFCRGECGENEAARICFEKCVGIDADFAESYYHMGICLLHEGSTEAAKFFEEALSRNPVLSGPHYYLGRMKMDEGDLAAAERELRMELELNPANSLAEFQLIRLHLLRVPWREAAELFDRYFPPEAFCGIPALKVCRFHFNYESLNENLEPWIDAVRTELPQTPGSLFHIAKVYRYKAMFGEAVETLKKAIETDKELRPAYRELAEIYRAQDDFARASEVLGEETTVFGDAEAYCELGKALISCGRYSEAEEAGRKAVSLEPGRAEAHYLLGFVLANMATRGPGSENIVQEARKCLSRALEIDPRHAAARAYLMRVVFQEGKYAECLQMAENVLKENPQDRLALWHSGRCFRATGELARAEERLLRLVELYPDDREGRGELAEVYRAQKRFKEAAEELEQAIAIPGRRPPPDLLFRLGEIYMTDLKQPARARVYFFHFLQTAPPGHPKYDLAKRLLGGASLE